MRPPIGLTRMAEACATAQLAAAAIVKPSSLLPACQPRWKEMASGTKCSGADFHWSAEVIPFRLHTPGPRHSVPLRSFYRHWRWFDAQTGPNHLDVEAASSH